MVRDDESVVGREGRGTGSVGPDGVGLIGVRTDFAAEKVLRLPRGVTPGAVSGTMWHGSLEGDRFRAAFIGEVARLTGQVWQPSGVSFAAARERRLELLVGLVEERLDVAAIAGPATDGAADLLPLPPGGSR